MNEKALVTASTFGAALAALGVAPELQADLVSLSFNPTSVPAQSQSVSVYVDINPIGASFRQWNDFIGKTIRSDATINFFAVSASQSISPNSIIGGNLGISASATGTVYVGFNHGGNVGWFSLDAGGFLGTIVYLEGMYGDEGETLHVGTIPAPGALALLALGAVGVRRSRKRAA